MRTEPLLLIALSFTSACVTASPKTDLANGDAGYRTLTGTALQDAVVGNGFVVRSNFPMPSRQCHLFRESGEYLECGDRIPFHTGSYTILEDRVCATGGPFASCWLIQARGANDYLLKDLNGTLSAKPVCRWAIGGDEPHCR
jgi:hypothetical protein